MSDEPLRSAAVAGDALAGLLGGIMGSAPERPQAVPAGRAESARPVPGVDVVASGAADSTTPGWTRTWLDVQLTNAGSPPSPVDVKVLVGVDGGSENDAQVIRVLGWQDPATGKHTTERGRPGT